MSRLGGAARAVVVLSLRGGGAALAVILTVVVIRLLDTSDAARFLLLLNVSTIFAVVLRWGLDEVIVRRVAAAGHGSGPAVAASMMRTAHDRVALVGLATGGVVAVVVAIASGTSDIPSLPEATVAIAIAALLALSASGGRTFQGAGRVNTATVILNIAPPALTLAATGVCWLLGLRIGYVTLLVLYGGVALLLYIVVVWLFPLAGARPTFRGRDQTLTSRRADAAAANRLGVVVMSQQALNWGALLVIPFAYGDAQYAQFNLSLKLASLVSLVMLAINFTYAHELAALFVERSISKMARLVRRMVAAVLVAVGALSLGVIILQQPILAVSGIAETSAPMLYVLLAGQALFSVCAVLALVLTMAHDEKRLVWLQGATTLGGLSLLVALSFMAPIELTLLAFVVAYATLLPLLAGRVRTVLRSKG